MPKQGIKGLAHPAHSFAIEEEAECVPFCSDIELVEVVEGDAVEILVGPSHKLLCYSLVPRAHSGGHFAPSQVAQKLLATREGRFGGSATISSALQLARCFLWGRWVDSLSDYCTGYDRFRQGSV